MQTSNRSFMYLILLVFTMFSTVSVFAETDFSLIWNVQVESNETVFNGMAIGDNVVLQTSDGFKAYSATGENLWVYHYPAGSYTLGMPVIQDDIAAFVIYAGKDAQGTATSSDALLNALDLRTGNLLWSAYLPQYLPLDYNIVDGNLFVSCQYISKPLKKKHVIKRWKSTLQNRRDTWLMCIDVMNGRQKWYQQVDGWIQSISAGDKTAYFQEYGSTIDGAYSVITSRNLNDGSLVWTSERFREELQFLSSYKQMDGDIFISDKKLVLINHDDGSTLRQIDVTVGSYAIKNGLFWNVTFRNEEGFYLQKLDLRDFVDVQETQISGSMNNYRQWATKKTFEKKLEVDLGYWLKYNHLTNNLDLSYFVDNQKQANERLYLPVSSRLNSRSDSDICDYYKSYFILSLYNGSETNLGAFTLSEQPELKAKMSTEANQQPVSLYDEKKNSLFTAYDNLFLKTEGEGVMDVVAENLNGLVLDIFRTENQVSIVDNMGIWMFGYKEKEPVIETPVEPEVVVTVALEAIPEPVKEEVVIPEQPIFEEVETEVDGWRIQIMYLTKTTYEKAVEYSKEAEQKTGYPVYVIRDGAIKLRVGNFISETEARRALTQVKNNGFGDAYLVKSKVIKKEKVQIN